LRDIFVVLYPDQEAAEAPVGHDGTETEDDDGTWADGSEEDEFEILSMAASCPMAPPVPHFSFDGPPDSAFEALE
jgi:hypothetical protein